MVIVTTDEVLVEWLAARGITGQVIATPTDAQVRDQCVITDRINVGHRWQPSIGITITQASLARCVSVIEMPKRPVIGRRPTSIEQVDAWGGRLVTCRVFLDDDYHKFVLGGGGNS